MLPILKKASPLLLTLAVAAPAGEHCLLEDRYCSEPLQASHEHLDIHGSKDVPSRGGRYAGITVPSTSTAMPTGTLAALRFGDWLKSS